MKNQVNLKMSYAPQGKNSANCGPCSLKMIADHYRLKKSDGSPYSVNSLNRILNVSKEWGCEKSDMARTLKRLGLKREKVSFKNLKHHLNAKRPVLSLFIDEDGGGHYAVIKGVKDDKIIFHDPYWGENYFRPKKLVKSQVKFFDNWLWAIKKAN